MSGKMVCGGLRDGARLGRFGLYPASDEKSLLHGNGSSWGSCANETCGCPPCLAFSLLLFSLEVDSGFQLARRCVAALRLVGYESCPIKRSFSSLVHRPSYFVLFAFITKHTARNFCITDSFVANGSLTFSAWSNPSIFMTSALNSCTRSLAVSNRPKYSSKPSAENCGVK